MKIKLPKEVIGPGVLNPRPKAKADMTVINEAIADTRIDFAIEVLNRALKADPKAIKTLLECRVPCNMDLADDPTIQVIVGEGLEGDKIASVGPLGLLNGILGIRQNGWGYIAAVYEVVCPVCKEVKDGVEGEPCLDCGDATLVLGELTEFKRTDR